MTTKEKRIGVKRAIFWGLVGILLLMLMHTTELLETVRGSFLLCANTIIPSLFPFMILSDMLLSCLSDSIIAPRWLNIFTQKVFSLPPIALSSFVMGAACGFPIGVKFAADLYKQGKLTEEETERTILFCNITGPAFVVTGIGGTLCNSVSTGILLYGVQLLSAVLCGIVLAHVSAKNKKSSYVVQKTEKQVPGGFVESVKSNTQNILYVCGFVVVFAIITKIISFFIQNRVLLGIIYCFLEIGGASSMAVSTTSISPITQVMMLTLAVNFGGASVHMQSACFYRQISVSLWKCLGAKLLQACIALCITWFLLSCLP